MIVPKGLTTVAFLKTRLDEGYDHLTLFDPLVLDALSNLHQPDFIAADIRAIVEDRTYLKIPVNTIQTLLGRCAKRKLLTRSGGRFFRTSEPIPSSNLNEARERIAHEQAVLADSFVTYAKDHEISEIGTSEQALIALATFISDNKVSLTLEEAIADSPLDRSSLGRKLTRTIARFITEHCLGSDVLHSALSALTEGVLLADVLLLKDLQEAAQRFQNLLVFIDTGILFDALDLTGTANSVAAKEGLSVLRQAGARTVAFNRTIDEMRQILAVYEQHLGTTSGRESLYPTDLTHHVLTERMSPADIRIISASLERRLEDIGIKITEFPPHNSRFTLDEDTLAKSLVSKEDHDLEAPRIRHDVDCVAGVLSLRAGRHSDTLERSTALFSTTSGRVVRNVQQWFANEGESGVPPIIHHAALTTIAWLKKPAAAPNVKMHELAAICVAAIRPSRSTWKKMVDTLRRLRCEGKITDDETAAIIASELTEPLLSRLDEEFEPDADSIQQAIERVKQEYRREAKTTADLEIQRARAESDSKAKAAEEEIKAAKHETFLAKQAADFAVAKRAKIEANVLERANNISTKIANFVYWVAAVLLVIAALLALPGVFDSVSHAWKLLSYAMLLAAAIFYAFTAIRGVSLMDIRRSLIKSISNRLQSHWLPSEIPST